MKCSEASSGGANALGHGDRRRLEAMADYVMTGNDLSPRTTGPARHCSS